MSYITLGAGDNFPSGLDYARNWTRHTRRNVTFRLA